MYISLFVKKNNDEEIINKLLKSREDPREWPDSSGVSAI